MQDFNYHTHTKLCKHAIGEMEEYVVKAIENGFNTLGFSDHIPYPDNPFDDRMDMEELDYYLNEFKRLKEKYSGQIQLYVGFESEYFKGLDDYYRMMRNKVDYLILGQHYQDISGLDFYFGCTDNQLKIYLNLIYEAIESNLFKYVCHLDYYMINRSTSGAESEFDRLLSLIKEKDLIVEINLKGLLKGKREIDGVLQHPYPLKKTFEMIKKYDIRCVYGLDVHNPIIFDDYQKNLAIVNSYLSDLDLKMESNLSICDL